MKLFAMQTMGVRGVADEVYTFANDEVPSDRVLITGEPGSGKTRLLDLLVAVREVLAPSGEAIDETELVREGQSTAKAIVRWSLTDEERATIGAAGPLVEAEVIFGGDTFADEGLVYLLRRYGHDDETPKLEYFSEGRRLDVGGGEMDLGEERQRRYRTSNSARKFAFVPSFLSRLPDRPAEAARFARALATLSRTCRYDPALHALSSGQRRLTSAKELSASEADAVMFAATATLVGLSRSILLVDTPELHGLDPRRALEGILGLGTDNQLFIATSAEELINGFEGAVVRLSASSRRF